MLTQVSTPVCSVSWEQWELMAMDIQEKSNSDCEKQYNNDRCIYGCMTAILL